MKDPELEAYVEAIESALARQAGRERVLSPRDFALARAWFSAGISLAEVLTALDEACASGHGASLAFVRRSLEARGRRQNR